MRQKFLPLILGIVFFIPSLNAEDKKPGNTSEKKIPAVKIDVTQTGAKISPYLYGQFIEHLGRCIDGGIWAEMLADRKFFHAVDSEESPWKSVGLTSEWKTDDGCRFQMTTDDPFVGEHTPEVSRDTDGYFGIMQHGIEIKPGKEVKGYAWVSCSGEIQNIIISLKGGEHLVAVNVEPQKQKSGYQKIEFSLRDEWPAGEMSFQLLAQGRGTMKIGTVSLMPADNIDGMRADTMALLQELDAPVYRWPGGNFVSGYDWRDGVGERDRRPPRRDPAWQGIEQNDFGLDEFMNFCRYLGTEPYIAVNSGNGNVENAVAELEYANGQTDTPWGKRRAENGHLEPYHVKYWGIGNEMYGDWQIGHMPVEDYAKKNNLFVDTFRAFDPNLTLIAVGAVGPWDEVIMRQCADHMDMISEHFYVGEKENNLLEHIRQPKEQVKRIADSHRHYRETFPELQDKKINIAMDEWNYWYGKHEFGEYAVRYFMKDGLGVAMGLHEFFRNSDIYEMANYAQTVNVLGCIKTTKTNAQFEPTGLALKLYRNHFGVIPVAVEAEEPLDVAAALTADKKTLTIGLVNPTEKKITAKLAVEGTTLGKFCKKLEVANPDPMAYNTPDLPQKIDIRETDTILKDDQIFLGPYSITLVKIPLK